MTVHRLDGLNQRTLMGYLAGLGLQRVVAEQADSGATSWFEHGNFVLETSTHDLAGWLVDSYAPTPVLSPWNEGSGFGAKDVEPKKALGRLQDMPSHRVEAFRTTLARIEPLAAAFRKGAWPKERLIHEIRRVAPDEYLPWLDAAVVRLADGTLAFPPLLGTGGNDGRLDFSTTFHQRLLEALNPAARGQSIDWATAALSSARSAQLIAGMSGQFDPGLAGTPGSSPFGAASSLVNPWAFILMIEGSMVFASMPARRFGTEAAQSSRAAMPFMTFAGPDGAITGSSEDKSRGEVWCPLWSRRLSYDDVQQVFAEGRTLWRGRTATRSLEMYESAASLGIAGGVSALHRFGLQQRNGLAFAAVPLDVVDVHASSALALVAEHEDGADGIRRGASRSEGVQAALREFDSARVALARSSADVPLDDVQRLLISLTRLDLASGRSASLRADRDPRPTPSGRRLVDLLGRKSYAGRLGAEARIALGLASIVAAAEPGLPAGRSMREMLLPLNPRGSSGGGMAFTAWRPAPIVGGLGAIPTVELMARVLARQATGRTPAPLDARTGGRDGSGDDHVRGFLGAPWGYRVPAADIHLWLTSPSSLDSRLLDRWFLAFLAVDWRRATFPQPLTRQPAPFVIDPLFAGLAPFRDGLRVTARTDGAVLGLDPIWPTMLQSGRPLAVAALAARRLRQVGRELHIGTYPQSGSYPTRLAAALVPRSTQTHRTLERVAPGAPLATQALSPDGTAAADDVETS